MPLPGLLLPARAEGVPARSSWKAPPPGTPPDHPGRRRHRAHRPRNPRDLRVPLALRVQNAHADTRCAACMDHTPRTRHAARTTGPGCAAGMPTPQPAAPAADQREKTRAGEMGVVGRVRSRYRSGMAALTAQTDADVVVRTFFDALANGSTATAADLLTDDVWWSNIGLPTIRGKRAVVNAIAAMHRNVHFDVQTHHLAVSAPADPTD